MEKGTKESVKGVGGGSATKTYMKLLKFGGHEELMVRGKDPSKPSRGD